MLTPELLTESYRYVDAVCILAFLADHPPDTTTDTTAVGVGDVVTISWRGPRYGVVTAIDTTGEQTVTVAYLTKSDLYRSQVNWTRFADGILATSYPETEAALAAPDDTEQAFRRAYLTQAVARRCRRAPWACRAVRSVERPLAEVHRSLRWNEPSAIPVCAQPDRPFLGPDARPDPYRGRTADALAAQLRTTVATVPRRNTRAAGTLLLDYHNGALLAKPEIVAAVVSYYANGDAYFNFVALREWLDNYTSRDSYSYSETTLVVLRLAAELATPGPHALWGLVNQPVQDQAMVRALNDALGVADGTCAARHAHTVS
jgi:hypothetical protein